jgi:hypothetical protein
MSKDDPRKPDDQKPVGEKPDPQRAKDVVSLNQDNLDVQELDDNMLEQASGGTCETYLCGEYS